MSNRNDLDQLRAGWAIKRMVLEHEGEPAIGDTFRDDVTRGVLEIIGICPRPRPGDWILTDWIVLCREPN